MSTLKLTIKKQFFDMILSGEKTEEYREIKKHWVQRLVWIHRELDYVDYIDMIFDLKNPLERHRSLDDLEKYWNIEMAFYSKIEFRNGYNPKSPKAVFEFEGIEIRTGNPNLGAEPDKMYFVIKLGKEISRENIK